MCEQNAIEHSTQGKRGWPIQMPALLAAHVMFSVGATWLCSILSPVSWPTSIAVGVFLAQACLIGIWLGVGHAAISRKCVLAVLGLFCLGMSGALAESSAAGRLANIRDFVMYSTVLFALLTSTTAAFLLILRKWKNAVLDSDWLQSEGQSEGLQFGVRHLLMVTTAVAFLLGLRTAVSAYVLEAERLIGPIVQFLLFSICWGVPIVAIVWAALGTKRPHERLAAAMALACVVAGFLPLYFGADWRNQRFHFFVLMTLSMFIVIAVSLLVARSAGYRLVRQCLPSTSATPPKDFDNDPQDG